MSHLEKICGTENPNRHGDVVFVHGLNGDAVTTWHPEGQPERFWPNWIGKDLPEVGIWSASYPASASAWVGGTMSLVDRAVNVLELLHVNDIGTNRPIVFVTHSLGGLLVKQMLRKVTDSNGPECKALMKHAKGIVFLSTPHAGSNLANFFVKYLKFLIPSVSVKELEAQEPLLRDLNTWYCDKYIDLDIPIKVYCERMKTSGVLVVDETSSNPGIPGVRAVPMDYDHITISRPERTSDLYRGIKKFVDGCLRPDSLNYPDCPQKCYQEIMEPGALLRIKAPRLMGKTFLLNKVLGDVHSDGYRIANVNLREADTDILQDLEQLLQWLCQKICDQLLLCIDVPGEWQNLKGVGIKSTCTKFFNKHFLANLTPLVIGLDHLDLIFENHAIANDFLGLLRSWYERHDELGQRLRMIIVYMQHYETTISTQSPLNVGEEVTLPDLSVSQIQDLVFEYGLNIQNRDIQQLTKLVEGHPFLIRLALRNISNGDNIVSLLESAHTTAGIYFNYLDSHLRYLRSNEDLATIMREVVCSITPVKSYSCCPHATRKLSEIGLIRFNNDDIYPANKLLRLYLLNRL
jgi:protein SERAC1